LTVEEFAAAAGVPIATFVLIFGLLVGSFLNVVIARVPAGESVVRPRSKCPKCGYAIPSWLNIPVLSWLVLRGKCAGCKAPISVRYPVVELLTGLLFLACYRQFSLSWALLLGMIFCGALLAITFIDIDIFEIPDEISLSGIVIGIVLRPIAFDVPWYSGLVAALLAAIALLGLRWGYAAVRGFEGMGMGDVKLLAMIGAFLGPGALLPVLLTASLSGLLVGGPIVLMQRLRGEGEEEEPEEDMQEDLPDGKIRLGLLIQAGGRTYRLGARQIPGTRDHIRAAWVMGARGAKGPGLRLIFGLFDEVGGWGMFEGLHFGLRSTGVKLWFGPMVGLREDLADGEDETWVPPKGALPFGPFLAMGALFTLFFGQHLQRWLLFMNT